MIDLNQETLISLPQATKPTPGGRIHISTLHRWSLRGIRGVRLETVLVGGKRFTSREALDRFIAETTAVADGGSARASVLTGSRKRAIRSANDFLDSQGL